MGAIKKMIEEDIPGIYVLSLMIGKNVFQVPAHRTEVVYIYFQDQARTPLKLCLFSTMTQID